MSAVPTELSFGEGSGPSSGGGKKRLSLSATAYLVMITGVACVAALPFAARLKSEHHGISVWTAFFLLAAGAALAQVLLVKTPRNQSYHATNVFLVPAILLLPPELVMVVAIVQPKANCILPSSLRATSAPGAESRYIPNASKSVATLPSVTQR